MSDPLPDLTEVHRLRAESHRLRDEARALVVRAAEAMSKALAAVPVGTRLQYRHQPGMPEYTVTRTGDGWVDQDGKPAHAGWVETYWSRDSLIIREDQADG